jgi:hypothetical protein
MDKNNAVAGAAAPPSLALVLTDQDGVAAVRVPAPPAKTDVRFAATKQVASTRRLAKPSTVAADKRRRPTMSPTSTAAATIKGSNQNLRRTVG